MKKHIYSVIGGVAIISAGIFVYRNYDNLYIDFINYMVSEKPTSAGRESKLIYQATKGKPLSEALAQLSQTAGITFKVNTDISNNGVTQSFSTNDLDSAIKQLLTGYNYSVIAEDHGKTVIISGYNGDAPKITQNAVREQIVFSPVLGEIPATYKSYPAGSVMPVTIPIDSVMALKEGDTADFNLPIGKFATTHDSTAADDMGNKTWIGHLSNEGVSYRMVLSQGAAGIMGHVTTPDGTYSVESTGTSTFLIDTRSFKSAGYEGDSLLPTPEMMNGIVQDTEVILSQLQSSIDSTKKAYDDAQAQVLAATEQVTKANDDFTTAYNNIVAAVNARNAAANAYNLAVNTYNRSKTAANQSALAAATNALNSANAIYNPAYSAYQSMLSNKISAAATLAAKLDIAAKAKSVYDAAVQTLADAQNSSTADTKKSSKSSVSTTPATTTTNSPSANSVVDLMALYTTASSSADYAKQRLQYLVAISNQAYKDSGINLTLRLVYAEPTTYNESTSNSQALADLAGERDVFAGIKAKRAQYGADLVFLFRPLYAKTHGSCGTTYVGFANGASANPATGFGTISDGTAKDNSGGYFCEINTATHEIGHSFGLVHDREYSNNAGAYSYSYAWGIQGKFGTIMSYKTPVVMLFSSPKLTNQCASSVCGFDESNSTQSSDQVKSANLTVPKVAAFMPTKVDTVTIK